MAYNRIYSLKLNYTKKKSSGLNFSNKIHPETKIEIFVFCWKSEIELNPSPPLISSEKVSPGGGGDLGRTLVYLPFFINKTNTKLRNYEVLYTTASNSFFNKKSTR